MIEVTTAPDERLSQGDIIRDVEYVEQVREKDGVLELSKVLFPLIIVLTQDCDLAQDHAFRVEPRETRDKWLISVLVAPLYNAEHVCAGQHLTEIGIRSEPINRKKTEGRFLVQNQRSRYHYLDFPNSVPVVPSVIDFKHYFSVPVPYLADHKRANFVCRVAQLYREDISQRFSSFLARVGLPTSI